VVVLACRYPIAAAQACVEEVLLALNLYRGLLALRALLALLRF
jgi:hypothetical protein